MQSLKAPKAPQLAIAGLEDPVVSKVEADRDADDQALWFEHVVAACRDVARLLTYDECAKALDKIWGERGRGVSASTLRAALTGTERNYFRIEWVSWFATQSELVADLLLEAAGRGKPQKTPEEELRDLKELLRAEFPRQAERLIRKAAAPR